MSIPRGCGEIILALLEEEAMTLTPPRNAGAETHRPKCPLTCAPDAKSRAPDARNRAVARLTAGARPALEAALGASLAVYDRAHALARFHRLSRETILSETPEAARLVLKEIDRALRAERARSGHWSYDLNRHFALLVARRAESARLARLCLARLDKAGPAGAFHDGSFSINSDDRSAAAKGT